MKKFENIVIVTDLDGTFLNDREGLVERNAEAIEYFKANGGHFTVATGRVALHALGAVPSLRQLVNMPMITCNGACVYDIQSERVCDLYPMRHELAMDIMAFIRENFPNVGVRAGAHEYCFLCTPEGLEHPMITADVERYKNESCLIVPLDEWKSLPLLKLVLRAESEELAALAPELEARFGESISFCKSWETIIDVLPKGVNKGVPFESYIRKVMPQGTKIYACGDYLNDMEMLKSADVAVCPSGAQDSIKAICDLCLCSNNEGLIADLIEYLNRS